MNSKRLLIALVLGMGLTMALLQLMSGSGFGPSVARAADLHVCPSGCTYSSIQAAVDAANDGDVIKVAAGTYTDVTVHHGQLQIVYIDKSITIRGGYTSAFTEPPDYEANPTTLDAQENGRVLTIIGDISPIIEGLRITGGKAEPGGGLFVNAPAIIRNNLVFSNTAGIGGGLALNTSGGLGAPTLTGNIVSYNTAEIGGGLSLSGSEATLSSNLILSNTATIKGGGLHSIYSNAIFDGNTISDNKADEGGGLYLFQTTDTLVNNMVVDNWASSHGSGLYIQHCIPGLSLLHSTIARNTGGDGSGIYITSHFGEVSTITLTNTTLVNQTVGVYVATPNTVRLEATLWGDGVWANGTDWAGDGTIITGNVNIWGDPAFTCAGTACNSPYRITPGSAALDKGVDAGVSVDIDHDLRPYKNPDLGADEYWPPGPLKRINLPVVLKNN